MALPALRAGDLQARSPSAPPWELSMQADLGSPARGCADGYTHGPRESLFLAASHECPGSAEWQLVYLTAGSQAPWGSWSSPRDPVGAVGMLARGSSGSMLVLAAMPVKRPAEAHACLNLFASEEVGSAGGQDPLPGSLISAPVFLFLSPGFHGGSDDSTHLQSLAPGCWNL